MDPGPQGQATNCIGPEWPQPQGIFTGGKFFHPLEFLARLREVYEAVVVEREPQGDMPMENEAFVSLLKRRTIAIDNGSILFKIYNLEIPDTTPEGLIMEHKGDRYLRLDCLGESREEKSSS